MLGVTCPQCGVAEMNGAGTQLNIRANKVQANGRWWSNCIVCTIDNDDTPFWF